MFLTAAAALLLSAAPAQAATFRVVDDERQHRGLHRD